MSDSSQFVAESLEELLVAIANGVREAQEALSEAPPFDAYGRPLPTYHLPYLDFDLKVDLNTVETSGGLRALRVLPIGGSQNTTQKISSSLTGRLVSIPAGDGLPVPVLTLNSTRTAARQHALNLSLSNSAGEILQNAQVEINFDLATSQQLSQTQGINLKNLGTSRLTQAILVTDEQGQAATELTIDSNLPAKASIVITAEFDQRISRIVVAAGNE
ncbi:hypothetical protein [Gynuella sunshinyii]|uniref:Uncharacterized protein n=1 Tax=Gynuella sunshinyii YC6258 TaxID=1445510 RepID=A0A0C5VEV5_9GAMM|nr:hypothetical protein [Gynuella sunshinyii]AJQ97770.1 hypothetical Protein YC6258_05742 [Gynuella sunshinyii YC6258]